MNFRRGLALCSASALLALAMPARAANLNVSMREGGSPNPFYFTPVHLIIRVGDNVTWRNNSSLDHTVTSYKTGLGSFDSSPGFAGQCDQGPLGQNDCVKQGETFEHNFDTAGIFHYYCKPHGNTANGAIKPDASKNAQSQPCNMCGTIEVRAPQSKPPSSQPTSQPPASTRKPTRTGSPKPSGSVTPTTTGIPTTDGSGVAAPGTDGGGGGGKTALALLSILALSGAGYATWRRFLAGR